VWEHFDRHLTDADVAALDAVLGRILAVERDG
jgi:hypothetical protein